MAGTERAGGPVLVLCPMRIEHDAVAAATRRAGLSRVRCVQTGIGKDAIVRVLERELDRDRSSAAVSVILAGACGGLAATDDVPGIARVIDTHGGSWTPPVGADAAGVTLVAVDRVVATPSEKRALALETGAAIVDMESHAFARVCVERGVRWGVVRGVSDTPEETLPGEVLRWISAGGDTRVLRAAVDLATKPTLVPHVVGVLRRSRRVLPKVGARVCVLAGAGVRR